MRAAEAAQEGARQLVLTMMGAVRAAGYAPSSSVPNFAASHGLRPPGKIFPADELRPLWHPAETDEQESDWVSGDDTVGPLVGHCDNARAVVDRQPVATPRPHP